MTGQPERPIEESTSIRHDLRPGDVGYITYLHGTCYGKEMGWDHTFDSYVALPLSEFSLNRSRREQIWIVEQDGKIVGSVAIVEHSDKQAQLRWLLLDPAVRGRGLGRHLVEEAMSFCRASGYSSVFLWTVASLEAAIRLYESAGFRKTEETTHAIWGGIVTEAKYELDLI